MKRKLVSLLLIATMCSSLIACGTTSDTETVSDETASEDSAVSEDTASEDEVAEEVVEEEEEEPEEEEEQESLMGYNMIENGDFAAGIDTWGSYLNGGIATLVDAGGALEVDVDSNGTLMHSVQVSYDGFKLYQGCEYEIQFDAMSSIDRDVEYRIQLNGGDYHAYSQEILSLTPEMQHFDITFTYEEADDPAPRLCFNLGNIDADGLEPHSVTFDNFELYCIDESGRVGGNGDDNTPDIQVNQIGYLPNAQKIASITDEDHDSSFTVVDVNSGDVVLEGTVGEDKENVNTERTEAQADFSEVTAPGTYKIVCGDSESFEFTIGDDVYDDAFADSIKMLYLQRCGEELDAEYAGDFAHDACHTGEAVYYDDQSKSADVSGGWHDAGDYGRYVVSGAKAVADLLLAYECYPTSFTDDIGIPESGNGTADVLDEARYELEWMFKMQDADGGVHHKVTCANFPDTVAATEETDQLYILPVSTTATGDYAAVMAMAARVYEDVDADFAAKCLSAAELAYDYLDKTDGGNGYTNPSDVVTGEYADTNDTDERLWAAAELFKTTSDSKYETAVADALSDGTPQGLGWADVGYYGAYAYLTSAHTDSDAFARAGELMKTGVDIILENASQDTYQASVIENYPWGSNMSIADNGMLLLLYSQVANEQHNDVAFAQLDYLLGNNGNSYCFFTGYGSLSPEHTHHRPSQVLGETMPGMLVGGPDSDLEDTYAQAVCSDYAPALCYVDNEQSYSTNEVTVYWNSPLVFLFAAAEGNK